jgi:hypothetical protein
MWKELDVPIGSITNGVHARTWLVPALSERTGRRLGPRARAPSTRSCGTLHLRAKRDLLGAAGGAGRGARDEPDVLTIGFARRFGDHYKRAGLLFLGPRPARGILDRGVRIVMAGKSHPADEGGKGLIQEVWRLARDERLGVRVALLADYGLTLARFLVQGVDVWLNTPLRPLEASGTSGMKAAMNGGLNCSILDGWWSEVLAGDGLRDQSPSRRRAGRGPTPARSTTCSSASDPGLHRARRARAAGALARDDARLDRAARPAVQTRTGWCASTSTTCISRPPVPVSAPPSEAAQAAARTAPASTFTACSAPARA